MEQFTHRLAYAHGSVRDQILHLMDAEFAAAVKDLVTIAPFEALGVTAS